MHTTTSLVLLIIGVIVLLGLFVDLIRKRNSLRRDKFTQKIYKSKANNHLLRDANTSKDIIFEKPDASDKIVVLNVASRDLTGFSGKNFLEAVQYLGLEFGKFQIFHKHQVISGSSEILYSVSRAREPGSFNLQTLEDDRISGICLFANVNSCPISADKVIIQMLKSAKLFAARLNCDILDHNHQPLPQEFISPLN